MDEKTEISGMYRSEEGVLINKDLSALKAYKAQKQKMRKLNTMEEEIKEIRHDMMEIKTLLQKLVT